MNDVTVIYCALGHTIKLIETKFGPNPPGRIAELQRSAKRILADLKAGKGCSCEGPVSLPGKDSGPQAEGKGTRDAEEGWEFM